MQLTELTISCTNLEERMKFKGLFIVVMIILVAESVLTGLIPHARGYLFSLLELKGGPIYFALGIYFCNYLVLDGFQAIKEFFIVKFGLAHRTDRSKETVTKLKDNISNTPQRIQEDIKLSYISRFKVWAEYFISGTIVVQLLLINLSEPILVVSALAYAAISVYIAIKFNPRLTYAEKEVQQTEATFRAELSLDATNIVSLPHVNKINVKAAAIRMQYLLFTKLQLGLVTILPYLVLIPSLLAGTIDLGMLIKHQATFALIVVNAAILIQLYPKLIKGNASEERVKEVENE